MATPSSAFLFEEQRGSERHQTYLNAMGIIPDLDDGFECRLIDMSDTGARVEIGAMEVAPTTMKLFVPEANVLYKCEVVRRDGNELGLRFISSVHLGSEQE